MEKRYKIGYTCGVFDMFHVGHLNLLERCKEQCDTLIVGLCNDDYVRNVKHHEPVFPEEDRLRILSALRCVDRVELIDPWLTSDKMAAWKVFQYDALFSGDDWKGSERYAKTEQELAEVGATVVWLPYTKGISTTQLKARVAKLSENPTEGRQA
ncbi:MAG: adenylyltransferase/cytidyltransferase family protein [Atopobiaceae bacterium]|nr:adenylyltransferase/cytidyltransferase family protein [Atopobiaceae bacterium]